MRKAQGISIISDHCDDGFSLAVALVLPNGETACLLGGFRFVRTPRHKSTTATPSMADDQDINQRIAELAERLRSGDAGAGNEIVALMDTKVRVIVRQKVPARLYEDVCQETWFRFFSQLLDGARPDSYVAWFLGIARFVCLEMIRDDGRTSPLDDDKAKLIQSLLPSLDRAAYSAQLQKKLFECLASLPERYRRFLIGHARDEDRTSLCDKLDLAIDNYSRFLYRTRRRLMLCMNGESA